jgi:16S rRNA U1498 N3-methylase RsmE
METAHQNLALHRIVQAAAQQRQRLAYFESYQHHGLLIWFQNRRGQSATRLFYLEQSSDSPETLCSIAVTGSLPETDRLPELSEAEMCEQIRLMALHRHETAFIPK